MPLLAFTPQDYYRLPRWINTPELNMLWGGPTYDFPLTEAQIAAHLANPQFVPYLFKHHRQLVGFIEISRVEPRHCRLCRVFIDPAHRGRGLARVMLQEAIRQAAQRFGARVISLAVFTHNHAALHCYRSLGFKTYMVEQSTRQFDGHALELARMRLTL
ncbi:GNAT family N-acetyltransferase [Musicola paradisiaca]|uniref:GCN5-related N-acetyltransferase n=1 Tax=Musicola paradisiaca (strain Ech703) TaxID=579405 RepID=C6C679_MUSP7|nr:GNAT family N-acetyltransferase [Musicola paradisiaca]ACS87688.1 GCN5-related N-acetyltransferase [Musicola paradisiaca Ech703]